MDTLFIRAGLWRLARVLGDRFGILLGAVGSVIYKMKSLRSRGERIIDRFSAAVRDGSLQCPDLRLQDVAPLLPSLPFALAGGPPSLSAFSVSPAPSGAS